MRAENFGLRCKRAQRVFFEMADTERGRVENLWKQPMYKLGEILKTIRTHADKLTFANGEILRGYGPKVSALVKDAIATTVTALKRITYVNESVPVPDTLFDAFKANVAGVTCWSFPFQAFSKEMRTVFHAAAGPYTQMQKFMGLYTTLKLIPQDKHQWTRPAWTKSDSDELESALIYAPRSFMHYAGLLKELGEEASKLSAYLKSTHADRGVTDAVDSWIVGVRQLADEVSQFMQETSTGCKCQAKQLNLHYIAEACAVRVVPNGKCVHPCVNLTAADLNIVCPAATKAAAAEWAAGVRGGAGTKTRTRPPSIVHARASRKASVHTSVPGRSAARAQAQARPRARRNTRAAVSSTKPRPRANARKRDPDIETAKSAGGKSANSRRAQGTGAKTKGYVANSKGANRGATGARATKARETGAKAPVRARVGTGRRPKRQRVPGAATATRRSTR